MSTVKKEYSKKDAQPVVIHGKRDLDSEVVYPASIDADGGISVNLKGHVCNENTTTTPLVADATFTGAWQDTLDYSSIIIGIKSDQNSATDGLKIEWSADGVNIAQDDVFTISANAGKVFTFCPANRYVRLKYINGSVDQTSFNLQTIFKKTDIKGSSHRINDSIVAEDDAELVKAVITGENPAGTFVNFQSTTAGNFKVSLEELETGISTNSKSQLNVSPFTVDEFGNYTHFLGDNIFQGSIVAIPPEHHEIHCGDSYETTYTGDLSNAASVIFTITVPDETVSGKLYHAKFAVDTESEALIQGYEGTTISATGSSLTLFNRNRNSSNTDYLDIQVAPTVTAGTLVFVKRIGSGSKVGGEVGRENEWILKNNTTYTISITNATSLNNYYNFALDYYVHPGV